MSANKAKYMFNLRLKRAKRNLSSQPSPNRTSFLLNKKKKESTLFSWYSQQLDERPILTKCVTACMISSTGNILAQKIKHDQKEEEDNISRPFTIECEQVGRFAFLNMIFVAPVLHHWYQFINRAVPGKSMSRVLQRVFWDEFVFSPVYIPVFLGGLWTLEGTKPEKINTMLYNELPSIIVAEWILWVPTMTLTFKYAPVKFQVLVINCVGVVWNTFLSFMANSAHDKQDDKAESEVIVHRERAFEAVTLQNITPMEVHLDQIFHQIEVW